MIKLYNDAFSVQDFEYLHNDMMRVFKNPDTEYRTSYTGWGSDLIPENPKSPVLIKPLEGEEFANQKRIVLEAFKKYSGVEDVDMNIFNVNYHFWLAGSAVEWHHDGGRIASTFYMNDDWDADDGGFLIYKDSEDNIMRAIPPTPNTCAVLQHDWHFVSATVSDAPVRMTIQIFYGASGGY